MQSTSPRTSSDIPAQTHVVSGAHLPLPATAHTSPARASAHGATDPVLDFFGYTLSSTWTHESRHDRRASDVPPPYAEVLPAYTKHAEPTTLAMYLFKFGFLFPPFWILGAIILLSPLRAPQSVSEEGLPAAWLPEKTEAERAAIIAGMRKAELKWAKRCLIALLVLVVVVGAAVVIAWRVLRD